MLKKSKNSKLPPLPPPPTVEEILKDLETFHVEINPLPVKRQPSSPDGQESDWWTRFEQAVDDQKSLIMLNSELNAYKLKLESTKMELETEAQLLKNSIADQQEQIDEVLSNGSG